MDNESKMESKNEERTSFNGFENNGYIIIPPESYEKDNEKEYELHRRYFTEFTAFYQFFKESNVIENILSKIYHASESNSYANLDMNSIITELQNISSNNNILGNIFTYLYFNLTSLLREKNIKILEYIGKLKHDEDHFAEELTNIRFFDDEEESNDFDPNNIPEEELKENSDGYNDNEATPLFPDQE